MNEEVSVVRAVIPGWVDDPVLGYIAIDLAAAIARYRRRLRDGRRGRVSDAQLTQWVTGATESLGFRLGPELDSAIDHVEHAESRRKRRQPKAGELLDQVTTHAQRRDWRFRHLVGIGALIVLGKPASEVLGKDRARLDIGESQDEEDPEPSFIQYIALAIERGEAAALDDIVRWMRKRARTGPKEHDWATILRAYRYTAAALGELRQRWNDGLHADARDRRLLRDLKASGLDVRAVVEQGRARDLKIARQLVARRFHVTASTIMKMWKKRATLLPPGDRLLAQGTDTAE
jgi:hypothetical protein